MRQVITATITRDGSLLMLENGSNRVQAFHIGSNPVRYFSNAPTPYFLPLAEMPTADGWRHPDIQADFSGLPYVLSTNTQTGSTGFRSTTNWRRCSELCRSPKASTLRESDSIISAISTR